jgi:CHASE1-domain containing sensor protein
MKLPHLGLGFFLSKDFSKNFWKALIVLIIGIFLTIAASFSTQHEEAAKAKNDYVLVCNDIKSKIASRLESYAQILRDGSAVFASADSVNRYEWKKYIDRTRIYNKLPGVQGVGYAILVSKNLLQQHIQLIRNEGFPNYTVKPAGDRRIYSSIIYLEPFSNRNLRAFGYDMLTEQTTRYPGLFKCH